MQNDIVRLKETAAFRHRLRVAAIAFLAVLGTLYVYLHLPRSCSHDVVVDRLDEFRSEIDFPRIETAEQKFLHDVIDGKVVSKPFALFSDQLAHAVRSELTTHGAVFTFQVPCQHDKISPYSELWLWLSIDYECGHVTGAGMYDRPVH